MRCLVLALIACTLSSPLFAQRVQKGTTADPDSAYGKLWHEYNEEYIDWRKSLIKNKEAGKIRKLPISPKNTWYPAFLRLARTPSATQEDQARAGLWAMDSLGLQRLPSEQEKAVIEELVGLLIPEFASAEWIGRLPYLLKWSARSIGDARAEQLLVSFQKASKREDALGWSLYHQADLIAEKAEKRAIVLLQKLLQKYPSSGAIRSGKAKLMQLTQLKPGMMAPEFSGKDVDGNPISLSDFRGKVTYLVFWGFW